jgi:hypothetical protein
MTKAAIRWVQCPILHSTPATDQPARSVRRTADSQRKQNETRQTVFRVPRTVSQDGPAAYGAPWYRTGENAGMTGPVRVVGYAGLDRGK